MTESELGRWFFVLMISLALGWSFILAVWERRMHRHCRDNQEIVRRMLGKKAGKR